MKKLYKKVWLEHTLKLTSADSWVLILMKFWTLVFCGAKFKLAKFDDCIQLVIISSVDSFLSPIPVQSLIKSWRLKSQMLRPSWLWDSSSPSQVSSKPANFWSWNFRVQTKSNFYFYMNWIKHWCLPHHLQQSSHHCFG